MGNNGSVDSVGNDGSSMNSVSNHGGSSDVSTSRGRGVLGLTSILNSSNVAGQVISVVGDGLDSAVGKVDGVRSSHGTGAIVGLRLLKVGLGVVIGHGVGVGVGGGLTKVGAATACTTGAAAYWGAAEEAATMARVMKACMLSVWIVLCDCPH